MYFLKMLMLLLKSQKNGRPTLKYYNGSACYYIHSIYEPQKEAKKFIEASEVQFLRLRLR